MDAKPKIGKPLRLYFSEIKHGDALKLQARSNISQTGGGARDERIRPVSLAENLRSMFPRDTDQDGVSEGEVYWVEPGGSINHTTVQLWRPTNARPDEARLGRVYTIGGWQISPDDVSEEPDQHTGWYYFLVQDDKAHVWAFVMSDEQLKQEPAWLRDFVRERVSRTPASQKVRGFIDRVRQRTYP